MPRERTRRAYLDIETDWSGKPTVVGVYVDRRMIQLVGKDVTKKAILDTLEGATMVYTYWGHRFDLPKLKQHLGLDIRKLFDTCDLATNCHRANLYGGLKVTEKALGIKRKLPDIDGRDAMVLWESWKNGRNKESLRKLLVYNSEDCKNLAVLRRRLGVD